MREMDGEYTCIVCKSELIEELHTTKKEVFVTGDRKEFDSRGLLMRKVICKNCGTVQFLQSKSYQDAVYEVYRDYEVMHDKAWIDGSKGHRPRFQVVYEKIVEKIHLPETGNMIDVGCGGGESLFWFHQMYPKWNLYGLDIGEQFRKTVTEREGVKAFFSSIDELKKSNIKFDLVTANNIISLANNVAEILDTVKICLADDGIFFVKDADYEIHPWLLYEIECAAFYTKRQMRSLLCGFGFDVMNINSGFELKEIGLFCKKSNHIQKWEREAYRVNKNIYDNSIKFLDRAIDIIGEHIENNTCIGIFGTSVAGVWTSQIIAETGYEIENKNIFYIEEDRDYLEKKTGVNGFPIYEIGELTEKAVVFLPFPRYVAENIKRRCETIYPKLKFVIFD